MGVTPSCSTAYRWWTTWPGATSPSMRWPITRCARSGRTRSTAKADLERGVVRAVGDPAQRFREDYLRILRGLRFSARLGFSIDPATWDAARAAARRPAAALGGAGARRVVQEPSHGAGPRRAGAPLAGVGCCRRVDARARWHSGRGHAVASSRASATRSCSPASSPVIPSRCCAGSRRPTRRSGGPSRCGMRRRSRRSSDEVTVRRWLSTRRQRRPMITRRSCAGAPARCPRGRRSMRADPGAGDALTRDALAISGIDLRAAGVEPGPKMGLVLDRLLDRVLEDPALNTPRSAARPREDCMTPDGARAGRRSRATSPARWWWCGAAGVAPAPIEGAIAFGAGFMVSVVMLSMLPEAFATGPGGRTLGAGRVPRGAPRAARARRRTSTSAKRRITSRPGRARRRCRAVAAHVLRRRRDRERPDGLAARLGALLFLAVFLHKLPEGLDRREPGAGRGASRRRWPCGCRCGARRWRRCWACCVTDRCRAGCSSTGSRVSAGVTLYVGGSNLVPEFQAKRRLGTAAGFLRRGAARSFAIELAARAVSR